MNYIHIWVVFWNIMNFPLELLLIHNAYLSALLFNKYLGKVQLNQFFSFRNAM